jgi:hypothetical protein
MVDVRMPMVSLGMCLRICTFSAFSSFRLVLVLTRWERLAPEVANVRPFWSYVGGAAGGAIGYIVGNIPGAAAGGPSHISETHERPSANVRLLVALAGNRLGAVRDAKGKSVAQVFSGLGASQKAEVSLRK